MNEAGEVCDNAIDFIRSESCLSPPGLRVGRPLRHYWNQPKWEAKHPSIVVRFTCWYAPRM